jgi:predicted nuclease of predicted toxin-antitoxin system
VKLLVDANLSPVVTRALREAGFDATHVADHGLLRAADEVIADFAAAEGWTVVTADSDFSTGLAFSGALSPSVVLFRSADGLTPAEQADTLVANLPGVEPDLDRGAVVSLRRGRLRVRRLPVV